MAIRAVIFDFGGVLVRTEDWSGRRKWEVRLGLRKGELMNMIFGSEVSARASVGLAHDIDVWKHVQTVLSLSPLQLAELQFDFWSGDRLDPELVGWLRSQHPQYKTGILSNAWPGAREAFSRIYGLDGAVDALVISAEEGVTKPDPRIYRIAGDRLGVQPEEAVFVDDVVENVAGARAVGMRGVHFANTAQAIDEVRRHLNGTEE